MTYEEYKIKWNAKEYVVKISLSGNFYFDQWSSVIKKTKGVRHGSQYNGNWPRNLRDIMSHSKSFEFKDGSYGEEIIYLKSTINDI